MAKEAKRVSAKYNVILACILVVLVGYYLIFELPAAQENPPIDRGTPIYLLDPWDVKKIQVVNNDGEQLVAERDGQQWRLLKGKQNDRLDETLGDFVNSLVMTVEIDTFPFGKDDLRHCGLDKPSYTVTVTDVTGKTYLLFVGETTPVGTCVYTRFADTSKILIVGALLNYELGKLDSLMQ
jgi:hypothetical protein